MADHGADLAGLLADSQRQWAEKLKKVIDESHGMWGAGDLKYAVHDALRLPAPQGDPGKLGGLAAAYSTARSQLDQVQMKVEKVASESLPNAWTGQVGEKAAEVVKASADDLTRCRDMLGKGAGQLTALAGALSEAQALHGRGHAPLAEALALLHEITVAGAPDPFHWDDDKMHTAKARAQEGIKPIVDAAVKAETAGRAAVRELNALASKALAGRFKNKGLGAADKLVLVDAALDGNQVYGSILTANDVTRAGQAMDRMSEADRVRFDPLFAFQLTTGGRPGDPAHDNGEAAKARWGEETRRVYDTRAWWHFGGGGMWEWESDDIADDEIGKHTGAEYRNVDLGSRDKRQSALTEIERVIDDGKPAPVSVRGDGGHQMMIIGHRGDQLEIYNPWGYTVWVSEADFVDNHMGGASDDSLPNVKSIRLPK